MTTETINPYDTDKTTITFECIGQERCINGKKLYLIYERPEDRKFAPQFKLDNAQLREKINMYSSDEFKVVVKS